MQRPIKWTHKSAKKMPDFQYADGTIVPMFEINSFHVLTQLIGYVKHTNPDWDIYYRGQNDNFDTMRPSLFRKIKKGGRSPGFVDIRISNKCQRITRYLQNNSNEFSRLAIPNYAIEPTLQHYGFLTRWIDLVDNVWIALWFGAYEEMRRKNANTSFVFVQPRSNHGYQYFYLIASDAKNPQIPPSHGLSIGPQTSLIDLRKACPSQFIRPHAQHGLLMKRNTHTHKSHKEMSEFVVCIIKLDLKIVQSWIGESELLSANYIYPSPFHDEGYSDLINYIKCDANETKDIGGITLINY